MPFSRDPFRRTQADISDHESLALPLRTASANLTPLRLRADETTTIAEWRAPWLGMFLTGIAAFGSITAGLSWAWYVGRIPSAVFGILLGVVWLAFFPAIAWIAFRTYRHAWRNTAHLVLDRTTRVLRIASLDGNVTEHAAEDVHALVHVSHMQQVGHGGNLWRRIDEFSILTGGPNGPWIQIPLFSLDDSGRREGDVRALLNELPRALDCDRIRIAFDRQGRMRGTGTDQDR